MKKKIKKLSIRKYDDGVAGIVVSILLVGLFISVLVMVQTHYVPNWMVQKEAEHMEDVANQFAQLKFAIDTQSIIGSNFNESDIDIPPITTSITLGSKEDPMFASTRSFGLLEILKGSFSINITNFSRVFDNHSLGLIKYSSKNAYFLDQSFVYEAGSLITEQETGSIMSIKPPLKVEFNYIQKNLTLTLCNIDCTTGRASVSGYGTYPVLTEFKQLSENLFYQVRYINITTNYPNAWKLYLDNTLTSEGLRNSDDYSISNIGKKVMLEFNDKNCNINLKLVDIEVEIAPGWIE